MHAACGTITCLYLHTHTFTHTHTDSVLIISGGIVTIRVVLNITTRIELANTEPLAPGGNTGLGAYGLPGTTF